jgi:anti-sigma B factor antagonist
MDLVTTEFRGVNGDLFPVLCCSGELDIASSELFKQAVASLLTDPGTALLVDMAGVGFVDSTGLGALIACHKMAVQSGGECRYVITTPKVIKLITMTGLDTLLQIFDSRESATHVI